MWLNYPDDAEAVKLADQYLWGPAILVAPVVEKSAATRKLYLPAGQWYDWWTNQKLTGHQWIDRPVDLATIPLYVKAGAIIPLDPARQYTAEPTADPTTLRIYPGADGAFTLYDDDGQTQAYLNASDPKVQWIRITWNDAQRKLTIDTDPRMQTWPAAITRTFTIEFIPIGVKKSVEFKGTPLEVSP
jgi:alpha-glucosidase (family GH31 glycosyl hydrolase)